MLDRSNLPFWVTIVLIVLDFTIKAIALGLVPERRRPSSGMAWLLLIFFLPGFGILLFLLLGSTFVNRRRRRIQAQAGMIVLQNNVYPPLPATATGPDWLRDVLILNAKLGWLDPVAGNRIELYTDYDASITAMATAVDRAKRFVHLEFYIVAWDDVTEPLFAALVAAVQRGVTVRLLYDHLASVRVDGYAEMLSPAGGHRHRASRDAPAAAAEAALAPSGPAQPSQAAGGRRAGRVQRLPEPDPPGYHNPKHERAGRRWKELIFSAEGPLAHSLNIIFATDWYLECAEVLPRDYFNLPPAYADGVVGQVLASGPGFPNENNLRMFNSLIYGARHRISITSPYFVPDESLLYAITTAAQRGVAVELFVSEESDQFMVDHAQKSYYTDAARGRGADLQLPAADCAARQAPDGRRRGRGDRVVEHGHPVVQPRLRGVGAPARA